MRTAIAPPTPPASERHDQPVQARITAEYTEMPGLRLTLPQAARLFHLEPDRCERVLRTLVDGGILSRSMGAFVRADSTRSRV